MKDAKDFRKAKSLTSFKILNILIQLKKTVIKMTQQNLKGKPVPVLEWPYADDTLPVATDSTSQTTTTDRRQDKDKQTDKALLLTDSDTPTATHRQQPTYRQADIPTIFVVDDKIVRLVKWTGRGLVVVIVASGVIIGVGYILVEVLAVIAEVATKAVVALKAVVEAIFWLVIGGAGLWLVYAVITTKNTEGGTIPNPQPPTPNNGTQNIQININNGNQKIN